MSWESPLIEELDHRRLHLRHGPIDLIIICEQGTGSARNVMQDAFPRLLPELCAELDLLRQPARQGALTGPIARRMERAALLFQGVFVTPMAAVAGAVADHVLFLLRDVPGVLSVNNGGDIAISGARKTRIGICENIASGRIGSKITLDPGDGVKGIATSGWQGRSHSLGIADAVTVLASSAGLADVAATLIGNATNVEAAEIIRKPARDLAPDSDLGTRLVTVHVPPLNKQTCEKALNAGLAEARKHLHRGLIAGCFISVQGESRALEYQPNSKEYALA